MAKIIPFDPQRRIQKKKKQSNANRWNENLAELVREVLGSSVDWNGIIDKSAIAEFFEIEDKLHLRLSLPGLDKSKLKLGLVAHSLRVRSKDEEEKVIHCIPLPSDINIHSAIAYFENGILEVQFQKERAKSEAEYPLEII